MNVKPKPIGRTSTGAKVTITLELTNLGSWGPECTTGQVYEQARDAAIGRLNRLFKDEARNAKVVGPIVVEAITTDLEKRG